MAGVQSFLLGLVGFIELATVSWCALWPLRHELTDLARVSGWWQLGGFALGNLDVMLLAAAKQVTLLVMVLSTPTRHGRAVAAGGPWRRGQREEGQGAVGAAPEEANHSTVRKAISALCGLHAAFLLVKAAAVAVTAPEQLWPGPAPAPAEGGGGGQRVNIGLVFLYVSIVVSLLSSLVGQLLARGVVSEREDAWEAAELDPDSAAADADSLRAPLLGAAAGGGRAAAAAAAGGRTDAEAGVAAAGKSGKAGGSGGGGGDGSSEVLSRAAAAKRKQRTLSELLRLSFTDWPLLLVAFSAGVLAALGAASIAFLTGQLIDFASIELDRSSFSRTTLRLLLVAGLTALFTGIRGGLFTIANTRLNVRIRKSLFHSLLQMEVGFFDTNRTGEIISRLSADTSTVSDQVGLNMNVMVRSATQAAMTLFFMFAASWRLTVVTFILVPVVLTISQVYGKFFSKMSKKVQAELANANAVADEVLSTMTTVKAHAVQDSAEAAYAAKLQDFYKLQLLEAGAYSLYAAMNTFLPNVVTAVVLFYGGSLVLEGVMSRGALVSFMLFQQSLTSAFQLMGDVFSALTAAVGAADKVVELMRRAPAISPSGTLVLPSLEGRVEARELVFHYPARPDMRVLNGLSLVAQPGEVVALVGPSGGGKSSIIKLLERFYVPGSGRILIDGHDLGVYDHKWLRRQVALVSQEPVLYARSIRRNIILGLEPEDGCPAAPSLEEVEEAAKQANAHDFISSFPEGYETSCGEKGVALSGGQKQRVAIARALVRRPRVLLLDEATSALDADSEAVVQEALDRVMHGRTVIVIAHRLSTIQGADRIYVIGKGVVQETGTHDDLLSAGGVYSQLVRRQLTRPLSQASMSGTDPPGMDGSTPPPLPLPPPLLPTNTSRTSILHTNLLSLARRQLANFLAASSSDMRPSVSATSLASLLPDDNNGQQSPQPSPQPPPQQPSQPQPQGAGEWGRSGGGGGQGGAAASRRG